MFQQMVNVWCAGFLETQNVLVDEWVRQTLQLHMKTLFLHHFEIVVSVHCEEAVGSPLVFIGRDGKALM